ncbi:c-type cytochrome domain-containing protein [Chryseolinea sp. T2]|uniref:c-type cytochrome domain-containing protein n=1 Tax=Chryseolinea sp. T2 TaxID=3129255 RepID=UPI003076A14D
MKEFVGRLHPLLVHLPIGILLLAAAFELLAYFKPYRKLRTGVRAMILFGAVASTLSVVSGLSLASTAGYDEHLIEIHRNAGIITTIFAWIVFFARDSIITLFKEKRKRRLVRIFLFIPLAALIGLTGHVGGSLTHGEDYLFASSSGEKLQSLQLTWKGDPDSARLYADIIAPILDTRCYSCHGPTKQKGQLRLDQPGYIGDGGKHGDVINTLQPDSSEIYRRLLLPLEDEHHMPPNEKPQLASAEVALIRAWLVEGAPFDKRIADLHTSASIKGFLQALSAPSQRKRTLPDAEVARADSMSVTALTSRSIVVIPFSDSTNYLSVSYINAPATTDDQLSLLMPLKNQVLSLDLGRTSIGDGAMQQLVNLPLLQQLSLHHTRISDDGLKKIRTLNQLQSLNIVSTDITDTGLAELQHLKALKKVWCFNTRVTRSGVSKLLLVRPDIAVDTGGYVLPVRVTDTLEYKAEKK